MAEAKRRKLRKREEEELDKPTKEEYAIAKHLRFNLAVKDGKLVGIPVIYFIASKAVDMLLESPWAMGKCKSSATPLFINRVSCIEYLDRLLRKGLFHRAARVEKKKERKKKRPKDELEESGKEEEKKTKKEKKSRKGKEKDEEKSSAEKKEREKETAEKEKDAEKEKEEEGDDKKDDDKKKKKKLKLEMHELQIFKDGNEVYVWIYDPVPIKTFVIGFFLIVGAILVCLFPLWPPVVRQGIYYLSLATAGFVGFILALCVVRLILFCLIWAITMGRHHFWFLPNLTEDVSFLESFQPLYKHDAQTAEKKDKANEEENKETDESKEMEEKTDKKEGQEDEDKKGSGSEGEREENIDKNETASEIENDNGYELVDRPDIDNEECEQNEHEEIDSEPKKEK